MTALGALAPAAAIVAIAPRLARAEAGFGIAAIGVAAVVGAARFPIMQRARSRIAIAVFVAAAALSVRLPFHFPSPRFAVWERLAGPGGPPPPPLLLPAAARSLP